LNLLVPRKSIQSFERHVHVANDFANFLFLTISKLKSFIFSNHPLQVEIEFLSIGGVVYYSFAA
jgi:hypothetical protein